jgi:hypothetical protein
MMIGILSDAGYGETALIVVSVIYARDFLPARTPLACKSSAETGGLGGESASRLALRAPIHGADERENNPGIGKPRRRHLAVIPL